MPSKLDLAVGADVVGLNARVLFDYANVHFDQENEVVAMLSLTAPTVDVSLKRPPLNIVAAIDCSTSMSGPKMVNAKASLRRLVDHLGPDDRLAIIGFHSTVFEVLPSTLMDGAAKPAAQKKIDGLRPAGWTNFSGALLQAFAEIQKVEGKKGCVNRIILFTDGEPTQGVTDPGAILNMLDKAMIPEISVSTFGYGTDHDTELLSEMAKRGKGNFFFVDDIDKCASMFGTELGGLLTTYAQNVKVTYTFADGVSLVKVLDPSLEVSGNTITMPDILGEESKHILLKLKLPKKSRAVTARPSRVVDFAIEYDSVVEAKHRSFSEDAHINYVRRKEEVSDTVNSEVQAQLDLVNAANVLENVKVLADAGNLEAARGILRGYRTELGERSHVYAMNLTEELGRMEVNLSTSDGYHATRGDLIGSTHSLRSRRAGGSARSAVMFSTSAQASTAASFSADPDDAGLNAAVLEGVVPTSSTSDAPAPPPSRSK